MKRMLINAINSKEWRIALVDGKKLYNLDVDKPNSINEKKLNIYKGIIDRLEPSLDAVFINYGCKRNGFLPVKEISKNYFYKRNVTNNHIFFLKKGMDLIVQIEKEEEMNKGALLTTYISLVGSFLILMPNNPNVRGISKKIAKVHRNKLKEIFKYLIRPKNMGLIIRTAGLGKSLKILQNDLDKKLKQWKVITKTANTYSSPILLDQESNIINRSFRDDLDQDIEEIIIDNFKILDDVYHNMNILGRMDFLNKIKVFNKKIPLFSYFQIESQITSIFQRKIRLFSGGEIVIDSTEALTVIDVNSFQSNKGTRMKETALNTNLEAADEISRQIRLRNLGGLIVIDFIDMKLIHHQRIVENKIKKEVKKDKARIQVGLISRFGLLEMSRQKVKHSINKINDYICSRCSGTGILKRNIFL
ncbi:Ribonuclease E [Buchnera aphidicola (Tetraneura ulmi)]|uniref:Rne/Rng family ribonuclease n=1 Tax=Buchnera aphidicola TaxID=9 RepID=UPI003464958B